MNLLVEFERVIYPRNPGQDTNGFMIVCYKPCAALRDTSGNVLTQIKAVGYCLPTSDRVRYMLEGSWSRSQKHGLQFEVSRYEEVIPPTRDGVIGYLASGQIKGIGQKTAQRIYDAFGLDALQVLDEAPERLLAIRGISERKLKKIVDSYLANRGARDVIAFLIPHGISPSRAVRLYRQYGQDTLDIVRKHPYKLCELTGIAFRSADKIAMRIGLSPTSEERIDEALVYVLTEAETMGHLCMEKRAFLQAALKLLDTPQIHQDMAVASAMRLIRNGRLATYGDSIYRACTASVEEMLARMIAGRVRDKDQMFPDLEAAIAAEERQLRFRLAPDQREAVKMGLTESFCVITGGPGTGKTSVQRAILDLYRKQAPNARIVCCAPTGKAARRMEQSTGMNASTIHKALGLMANEDGEFSKPQMLEADLVLVDEVSMLDVHLAKSLFDAVPSDAKLILVGDSDQLPSVGPGAILRSILDSGLVPVVRLDQVFRQKKGSLIAVNAKLIRHGNLSLEYGPDFQLHASADLAASAERIEELYLQEVARHGIDQVALLSPFRQRTETGVNALNLRLQDKVNPLTEGKAEIIRGSRRFRTGDKVMQIRNRDDISNGDIGYITGISGQDGEKTVHVDFGDGRKAEYDSGELDLLDLGYASTVHKSQGSEYKSVIISLQCAHSIMLVRPLIYTAITRAKECVHIVGDRKALCTAIRRTDTERRGTKLAERIKEKATRERKN